MRPQGPTFWHLDGNSGWQGSEYIADIAQDHQHLRLEADPQGPLHLLESFGSLGRLTLPQGFAIDEDGIVYLQAKTDPFWIKRFNPENKMFETLPTLESYNIKAASPQFPYTTAIAAAGTNLYIVEPVKQRVLVFDCRFLVLRYVWEFTKWLPVDVTSQGNVAYILDKKNGRVYAHKPRLDRLHCLVDQPKKGNYSRIIVDRDNRIYLLNAEEPDLDVYDASGKYAGSVNDANDVRDRFEPPPIMMADDGENGRFCLPADLQRLCTRQMPEPPIPQDSPLAHCLPPPWSKDGLTFNRQGLRLPAADPTAFKLPRLYQKDGTWISKPLNSDIYQCHWHRVELEVSNLPPGSTITISTYTSETDDALERYKNTTGIDPTAHNQENGLWSPCHTISGPMQMPTKAKQTPVWHDCLIQSQVGQYLWVRLDFKSDGYVTPLVSGIRTHYPRISYLDHLPAVFSGDDESRWFLERFLSIAQTEWDNLESEIEEIGRYFDPHTVPEGEFLAYLAEWIALPLEGSWDWTQKRRLLEAAPGIYTERGMLTGLRRYIGVYLQNMIGLDTKAVSDFFPQILEGYRLRQYLMLNQENLANIGRGLPLWSPQVVGRLQLGVYAREGEVRLVSTGDPENDYFHEFAHRFQVFVPASWVKTAVDEQMLRRAIDSEKPAHAEYELHLVESRLQIEHQSTVGVDTIIGAYPTTHLACNQEETWPSSRKPMNRLGLDTVLSSQPEITGIKLKPGTRVGIETVLN